MKLNPTVGAPGRGIRRSPCCEIDGIQEQRFSLSRTLTESYCCHSSILVLAARFVLLLLNFASGFQDFAIVLRKNF